MYSIDFTNAARRQLKKIPHQDRTTILDAIETLASNPRPPASKNLVGIKNSYRLRVGNYRVLYEVIDNQLLITVFRTGHRREVYKDLH